MGSRSKRFRYLRAVNGYSFYYINNNIKKILAISLRFPNIFRRFLKIIRLSRVHTNISHHFQKISEDVRRLPKVAEYFRAIFEDVSLIRSAIKLDKLGSIYDVIFSGFTVREILVIH